ncbi:Nitrogen regulation protein NtrB [hydrothermal vent metagenome]|uniref:Sensory histidine kinase/phosphatase NtrB n=1 Tax=hydrothermal vent metagenome TaxID=652676 RepID=A0A3B0ZFM8_9ZZZZ
MAKNSVDNNIAFRVLENLNYAVLLFDQKLKLRYLNVEAERLFGNSARHLLGQTANMLFSSETDIVVQLDHAISTLQPFTHRAISITLSYKNSIMIDLTASPFSENQIDNEIIVEINQVDRMVRIAQDEILLKQQNITQEIVRGLAHEVKNPLGGLRGAAQLLEKQLSSDELKEYTQVIISEADRLQSLVNKLLGPSTLAKQQRINIHEILERVRNLVQVEINSDIKLHRDYDPSIPDMQADPDQLIQAILNIVQNAVQALSGSGNIYLKTRIQRQFSIGHQRFKLVCSISIIDDGPGIPNNIRDRIFYPLVTSRAQGTGIGLSIAQSLIQKYSGIIECNSIPGNTEFTINIPIE